MIEAWITVVVALIVALSTLGATFLQNRHSNKRFEKELERAKDVDYRQRRREVRSEPLLKLKNELSVMAAKQARLVNASSEYLDLFGTSDREEIKEKGKELRDARNNWNTYLESGILKGILFLQNDKEVVNEVEEILKDYNKAYVFFEDYWDVDEVLDDDSWELKEAELVKHRNVFERNSSKIIEVQELINKRLEEL